MSITSAASYRKSVSPSSRSPFSHSQPGAVLPTAISIGFNPTYDDVKEKVVEAWILDGKASANPKEIKDLTAIFEQPFYGEEMRLMICILSLFFVW